MQRLRDQPRRCGSDGDSRIEYSHRLRSGDPRLQQRHGTRGLRGRRGDGREGACRRVSGSERGLRELSEAAEDGGEVVGAGGGADSQQSAGPARDRRERHRAPAEGSGAAEVQQRRVASEGDCEAEPSSSRSSTSSTSRIMWARRRGLTAELPLHRSRQQRHAHGELRGAAHAGSRLLHRAGTLRGREGSVGRSSTTTRRCRRSCDTSACAWRIRCCMWTRRQWTC